MEFFVSKNNNPSASFKTELLIDNGFTLKNLGLFDCTFEFWLPRHIQKIEKDGQGIIEWCIFSKCGKLIEVVSIGVYWERKKVYDFDGTFELTRESITFINHLGLKVAKDLLD